MGLDMYLRKSEYVCTYDFGQKEYTHPKKVKIKVDIEYEDGHTRTIKQEQDICDSGGLYIQTPYAYWRKANAIHKWILEKTEQTEDKCQPIYVSGKALLELVDICKQILEDHSKAEKLLPTQSGFFFGSTEYDEWYFQDLELTVKQLENVKAEDDFIYQASW